MTNCERQFSTLTNGNVHIGRLTLAENYWLAKIDHVTKFGTLRLRDAQFLFESNLLVFLHIAWKSRTKCHKIRRIPILEGLHWLKESVDGSSSANKPPRRAGNRKMPINSRRNLQLRMWYPNTCFLPTVTLQFQVMKIFTLVKTMWQCQKTMWNCQMNI